MNEQFEEDDDFMEAPEGESEIMEMLKKIQQQLSFLEKKVDSLIGQSQNRPPRDRNYSKPFRPGGHRPHFQKNSDRDHRSGDRDRRPDGNRSDDRRPDQGRPYENSNPRRNRGFNPRKKEGYYGKRG